MGCILTKEGGFAVQMKNKTGAVSKKGTLVASSSAVDNAFIACPADVPTAIGVVYNDGSADGEDCYIVISGIADVLIEDSTASVHGNWVVVGGTTDGRADATATLPPGGLLADHDVHFGEIGHCLESKSSGTDVMARCLIHFN